MFHFRTLRLFQAVACMTVLAPLLCPMAEAQISVTPLIIEDLTVYLGGLAPTC